ncbi:hypothetical protein [uncultured Roseobacter sp.]|uniref:hypothetical protein n=1 Tax=uncultured Roseobacter sp. TaxID=114847 RepID=UPI002625DBFB|nr:hypothetical protein [uncultured Roseobacter sp.]
MRFLLALCLFAAPATAWEFTPGLPCVLSHRTPAAEIELTYDPTGPLYTVTVRQADPFDSAPVFAMQFDGALPISIATDRHMPSRDGRSVTVTDRGFGNVLNGLQYNETVTATLGSARLDFALDGAAEPVAAFRACQPEAGV